MNVLDRLKLDVVNCSDFPGNRPYAKADEIGARVLLFNPDADQVVDANLIIEAIARGYVTGLRFNCTMGEDPVAFANKRSATIETLGGKTKIAVVMFDTELEKNHSEQERLAWQAAMIDRWDRIRYARPTFYDVAPFQDQTQNDYTRMLQRNQQTGQRLRKISVQTYVDQPATMTPLQPLRAAVDYLAARGLSRDDLEPTLDPKTPLALAGYDSETRGATIFEAGRIP